MEINWQLVTKYLFIDKLAMNAFFATRLSAVCYSGSCYLVFFISYEKGFFETCLFFSALPKNKCILRHNISNNNYIPYLYRTFCIPIGLCKANNKFVPN